jgi:hypothetical protein
MEGELKCPYAIISIAYVKSQTFHFLEKAEFYNTVI